MSRRLREALPLLPFLALVAIFLIVPTVTVIVSAFHVDGRLLARQHRGAVLRRPR